MKLPLHFNRRPGTVGRLAVTLLLLSTPAADAACAVGPKLSAAQKNAYKPPYSEKSPAQDLNEYEARGLGIVPAPSLQAYLQAVLDRLIAGSQLDGLAARVYLSTDIGFGAQTSPASNIYVDLRLILDLSDEDEVAGVLAHELSHLILRHANKRTLESQQEKILALSDLAISVNEELSRELEVGQEVTNKTAARDYQDLAYRLNRDIVSPGWGPKQELAADLLGIDLLAAAGYDPNAMMGFLGRLQDQQTDSENMLDRAVEARASLHKATIEKFAPDTPSTGHKWADQLVGIVRSKVEDQVAASLAKLSRSHPDPDKRVEQALGYLEADIFQSSVPARSVEPLKAVKASRGTAALLRNYEAAFKVENQIGLIDDESLVSFAQQSVGRATADHPFPRMMFYQIRKRQRQLENATANLQRALKGPTPSGQITTLLANHLIEHGRARQASAMVDEQWKRMGEASTLYPLLIRVRLRAGQTEEAQAISELCGTTSILGQQCATASKLGSGEEDTPSPAIAQGGNAEPQGANESNTVVEKALSEGIKGFLGAFRPKDKE